MPAFELRDLLSLEEELWSALGSDVTPGHRRALASRIIGSPEFQKLRSFWREPSRVTPGVEVGPASGTEEGFVRVAYAGLLCRPPDENGLRHYVNALTSGGTRAGVLRSLVLSEEFERRFRALPQDTQLCELANPAKWDNAEWLDILRSLGLADDKLSMHRKPYELAQLIYGCRALGVLRDDASIVSVGAGHEPVLYWLANHVRRVIATDIYEGIWRDVQAREGDPDVLRTPETFAPFPYRRDHLTFMRMDGRRLAFRDGSFDIAYSLSSIEHFGGLPGAVATVREMTRVLKPGGVLVLGTEYVLDGPRHEETFLPKEIAELVHQPGLELVQPIDETVYRRYSYTPVDLYNDPYQTPHMVVRFNDTVFTTVMLFLRRV
jgi:SAM-dependent methyltransferase